jgi:hypothetical protein
LHVLAWHAVEFPLNRHPTTASRSEPAVTSDGKTTASSFLVQTPLGTSTVPRHGSQTSFPGVDCERTFTWPSGQLPQVDEEEFFVELSGQGTQFKATGSKNWSPGWQLDGCTRLTAASSRLSSENTKPSAEQTHRNTIIT